jgi:hypothetical protein
LPPGDNVGANSGVHSRVTAWDNLGVGSGVMG